MWKLGMVSGLILGIVVGVIGLQFAQERIHQMPYWRGVNGFSYSTLEDCLNADNDCRLQVGWFIE